MLWLESMQQYSIYYFTRMLMGWIYVNKQKPAIYIVATNPDSYSVWQSVQKGGVIFEKIWGTCHVV